MLDNYDSFTYNLVHIIRELGHKMDIYRNDKIALDHVDKYDKIVLSPGPGIPDEAGIMKDLISTYGKSKGIFGVCLGHQGISEVFGASLFNIPNVLHGVTSMATVTDPSEPLFKGIPESFRVCHYHSWSVVEESVPDELKITAVNETGLVMGISHREYDVRGVQFHPESVMTEHGIKMMDNWLKI